MSDETQVISRRTMLCLFGLAATTVGVPSTILMVSEAEATTPSSPPSTEPAIPTGAQTGIEHRAQATTPLSPPPTTPTTPPGAQTGTERRQARRTKRVKRRTARRSTRKKGREERAKTRKGD
jgi:hypothetical protein